MQGELQSPEIMVGCSLGDLPALQGFLPKDTARELPKTVGCTVEGRTGMNPHTSAH